MTFTRPMHHGQRTITVRAVTPTLVLYDWSHREGENTSRGSACAMTPEGFKRRFNVEF